MTDPAGNLLGYRVNDKDILLEKEVILSSIDWDDNEINLNRLPDWEEEEHKKIEANQTFIQLVDDREKVIFKSANLKDKHFLYDPKNENANFYNTKIDNQRLRLGQFPIKNDKGKLIGQLSVGVSRQ